MLSVTIIGIGRVGRALAASLQGAGYQIDALVVRSHDAIPNAPELGLELFVPMPLVTDVRSDVVFICTQDQEVSAVAAELKHAIRAGTSVFHTSGALSSSVLEPLLLAGAHVGSMHPLISITERAIAEPFHGAYFCLEGDAEAVAVAKIVAADLGGIPFSIDTRKKALYHASAVMASGHLVALADAAFTLMETCGPDPELSRRLLMPLVTSTIANISAQSTSEALTGPFARTDSATIDGHLEELEKCRDTELLEIYVALGKRSLDLAMERGADESNVLQIRKSLSIAERKAR